MLQIHTTNKMDSIYTPFNCFMHTCIHIHFKMSMRYWNEENQQNHSLRRLLIAFYVYLYFKTYIKYK